MVVGFIQRVTHRHLHLELILVELEEDVRECPLQEGGGPQNQNQLEVAWEGALRGDGGGDSIRTRSTYPLPLKTVSEFISLVQTQAGMAAELG